MRCLGVNMASFLLLFLSMSCQKEGCHQIPDVPISISISQGSNIDLSAHGNYVYFLDQGYAGVVLLNNNNKINAFDLCSPINPKQRNSIHVVDNAYFFDQQTGAKWLLDGSPAAITSCPLKTYVVSSSNDGFTFNVRN